MANVNYPTDVSVLILVDVLNDFLAEDGKLAAQIGPMVEKLNLKGTGRHALEAGYHVTFLVDGVAEFTEKAHRAALEISYPTFGHEAITIEEFLQSIHAPSGSLVA